MSNLHQRLPANLLGQDFIVGDLHGCLDLLQIELDGLDFNPAVDRLFSVGDLADRGPDSMGCLRLLRESWFYAVRGNHEEMLLDYAGRSVEPYSSSEAARQFFRNGGRWVLDLGATAGDELWQDLVGRMRHLPYVITVGEGVGQFHVAHAELVTGNVDDDVWSRLAGLPVDQTPEQVLTDDLISDAVVSQMIEPLTWGRRLVRRVDAAHSQELDTPMGALLMSQQPMRPGLSFTYVGHTPLTTMILHESHLFIDRGAYTRKADSCLQVLRHDEMRAFLVSRQ